MEHRLRLATRTETLNKPLDRDVNADDAFIGGKETNNPSLHVSRKESTPKTRKWQEEQREKRERR